jgi:hypothetical protein
LDLARRALLLFDLSKEMKCEKWVGGGLLQVGNLIQYDYSFEFLKEIEMQTDQDKFASYLKKLILSLAETTDYTSGQFMSRLKFTLATKFMSDLLLAESAPIAQQIRLARTICGYDLTTWTFSIPNSLFFSEFRTQAVQ